MAGPWSISRPRGRNLERYAKDICATGSTSRSNAIRLIWINLLQCGVLRAGFAVLAVGRNERGHDGIDILMFGVFVRTVLVWHITWAINSVTHVWGYRNYETDEDSRNNLVSG